MTLSQGILVSASSTLHCTSLLAGPGEMEVRKYLDTTELGLSWHWVWPASSCRTSSRPTSLLGTRTTTPEVNGLQQRIGIKDNIYDYALNRSWPLVSYSIHVILEYLYGWTGAGREGRGGRRQPGQQQQDPAPHGWDCRTIA